MDKQEALRLYHWILKAYGKDIPLSFMRDIRIFRSCYTYPKDKPWGVAHKERVFIKVKGDMIIRIQRETQKNREFSLESEAFVITEYEEIKSNEMP